MTHNELGALGEDLAMNHLRKLGHQIIELRWRKHRLEIDLITLFQDKIHFVEVKTRNTEVYGEPWRAITRSKQRQVIRAADTFLKEKEEERESVFDVVSIIHNQYRTDIEFIPEAFTP